jgi:hypothetical protein
MKDETEQNDNAKPQGKGKGKGKPANAPRNLKQKPYNLKDDGTSFVFSASSCRLT